MITRGSKLFAWSRLPNSTEGWVVQSQCPNPALIGILGGGSQLCGAGVDLLALIALDRANRVNNPNLGSISFYGTPLSFFAGWKVRRAITFIRNTGTYTAPGIPFRNRPVPTPNRPPRPVPTIPPMADPWPFPGVPAPDPIPLPHWAIPGRRENPNRAPSERRQAGNNPGFSSSPRQSVEVWPGVSPGRGRPAVPKPLPQPPVRPRPPRPNEKERKARAISISGTVVGAVFSKFTEGLDFVNAFWRSIPEKYRGKYNKSVPKKLADIWKYWDKVSLSDLAVNLALEQGEDMIFGGIGSINREASRQFGAATGRPVGFQFGPLF